MGLRPVPAQTGEGVNNSPLSAGDENDRLPHEPCRKPEKVSA